MEQRNQIRYGVKALVDFEWMDAGVFRRGQGVTRDISPKGMFIYSDIEPPVKADLRVTVSFQSNLSVETNLQMKAKGVVIRVEPAASSGARQGFAILHRSYELQDSLDAFPDSGFKTN